VKKFFNKNRKFFLLSLVFLLIYILLPGGKDIRYAILPIILMISLSSLYISEMKKLLKYIIIASAIILNISVCASMVITDFNCSKDDPIKIAGEYLSGVEGNVFTNNFWPQLSWYSGKNVKYLQGTEKADYIVLVNSESNQCKHVRTFKNYCHVVKIYKC
jgi:hypothetical protein